MRKSIRTRFTLGMVFFFLVIAALSILSAYHLNKLSSKTDAILKENHFSVIFARDMAEGLTIINQEINQCFVTGNLPDGNLIDKTSGSFEKSLQLEKNNITEAGEDKLVSDIESGFNEYRKSIAEVSKTQITADKVIQLQTKFHGLYEQTMLLSQMNEQAIILKANDAKKSAEKGLTHVTLLGTICFIITLSFTFNFATYFNERFSKLYNGIKEIGANNYRQRLYFEGEDEFYDISLIFNEMAENLNENRQISPVNLKEDLERENSINQIREIKKVLDQMEGIRERAINLIAKLENKE
jgi:methyl-accepting chemotaxis protein